MNSLFSSKATLLILLSFLVPEALRAVNFSLEPYPAVLLPAGATKIAYGNEELVVLRTALQAQRDREWRRVDPGPFLDPIPAHFINDIARGEFGLRGNWAANNQKFPPPARDREQLDETKRWLRQRLGKLGYDPAALRLTREELVVDLRSRNVRSSRILLVRPYDLD